MSSVGVAAAIFDRQGRILCVRQNYRDELWALPGGAVEPGESPIRALEREVREETGYLVRVGILIGVYATPWKDTLFLCFEANIVGEEDWLPNGEIAARAFFERGQLPVPMSSRMKQRILDAFDGERGVMRVFESRE
jgi:8-oxo-dGTP diphosphatase